jgi:hypothetical protein
MVTEETEIGTKVETIVTTLKTTIRTIVIAVMPEIVTTKTETTKTVKTGMWKIKIGKTGSERIEIETVQRIQIIGTAEIVITKIIVTAKIIVTTKIIVTKIVMIAIVIVTRIAGIVEIIKTIVTRGGTTHVIVIIETTTTTIVIVTEETGTMKGTRLVVIVHGIVIEIAIGIGTIGTKTEDVVHIRRIEMTRRRKFRLMMM